MSHSGYTPGVWSAICDVCGFTFGSNELKERWDGLRTCKKDWEGRHPQDFIRAREEKITPPWTRPEAPDTFENAPACFIWDSSGYADLASADCAQAANTTYSYLFLLEAKS